MIVGNSAIDCSVRFSNSAIPQFKSEERTFSLKNRRISPVNVSTDTFSMAGKQTSCHIFPMASYTELHRGK